MNSLPARTNYSDITRITTVAHRRPHQEINSLKSCGSSRSYRVGYIKTDHYNGYISFLETQEIPLKSSSILFPEYLTICPGGCASRDELLEKTAGPGAVDTGDNSQWGPSCNKAVREVFPESQALRKGKYKKLVLTKFVNLLMKLSPT